MSEARAPGADLRPGDWRCPRCNAWPLLVLSKDCLFFRSTMSCVSQPIAEDHVFARNENCRPVGWSDALLVSRTGARGCALGFVKRRCGQARPTGHDMAAMAAAGTLPPNIAAAKGSDLDCYCT